jgi:hypothetical protein
MTAVPAEIHVDAERGEHLRHQFEAGRKAGVASILNGPTLETLTFEITVLRIVVAQFERAVADRDFQIRQLEDAVTWYRDRAAPLLRAFDELNRRAA